MLDYTVLNAIARLYRGKPYTRSVPFQQTLPAADGFVTLWLPNNKAFELQVMFIRASVAGADLSLCDSDPNVPFAFVVPDTGTYTPVNLGTAGYRSIRSANSALLLTNPGGAVGTVKGYILGFEVNPDGSYT